MNKETGEQRDRKTERQRGRETKRQIDRKTTVYLHKIVRSQNAEMPLMFRLKISVKDAPPIAEEIFSHLFNDQPTSVWTKRCGLETRKRFETFVAVVEDSLSIKVNF